MSSTCFFLLLFFVPLLASHYCCAFCIRIEAKRISRRGESAQRSKVCLPKGWRCHLHLDIVARAIAPHASFLFEVKPTILAISHSLLGAFGSSLMLLQKCVELHFSQHFTPFQPCVEFRCSKKEFEDRVRMYFSKVRAKFTSNVRLSTSIEEYYR